MRIDWHEPVDLLTIAMALGFCFASAGLAITAAAVDDWAITTFLTVSLLVVWGVLMRIGVRRAVRMSTAPEDHRPTV